MNVYDLRKIEKCFVCGNIDKNLSKFIENITANLSISEKVENPKEIERQKRLENRRTNAHSIQSLYEETIRVMRKSKKTSSHHQKYDNSVIVVSGNCGIGSKSMGYYEEIFSNLEKTLAVNNCYVLFMRGNNDNPSIFHDNIINFEHIKTIQDYSIIMLKNYNCLCIGGSISFDKEWKLAQEKILNKQLYWKDENPYFDQSTLEEILSKFKIGCVITSTSPSFAFPGTNSFNRTKWAKDNTEVKTNFSNERKTLDKIYNKIMDSDAKPYVWIYGRFKQHNENKMNDIVFNSLSAYEVVHVNELIQNHFLVDFSKKLDGNDYSLDFNDGYEVKLSSRPRRYEINNDLIPRVDEDEVEENDEGVEIAEAPQPQMARVEFNPFDNYFNH